MTKRLGNRSFLLVVFGVFIFFVFLGFYALIRISTNENIAKLNDLKAQLDEINKNNSEVEYLLNEADEAVLYERLARERGYVYANEKVYYDVTPGN